jgi:hypothetical protein
VELCAGGPPFPARHTFTFVLLLAITGRTNLILGRKNRAADE